MHIYFIHKKVFGTSEFQNFRISEFQNFRMATSYKFAHSLDTIQKMSQEDKVETFLKEYVSAVTDEQEKETYDYMLNFGLKLMRYYSFDKQPNAVSVSVKKKIVKDINAPPRSGYNLFQKVISQKCKDSGVKASLNMFTIEWKKLTADEKGVYNNLCKSAKNDNTAININECTSLVKNIEEPNIVFKHDYATYLKMCKFLKENGVIDKKHNSVKFWSENFKSKTDKQLLIDQWFLKYEEYENNIIGIIDTTNKNKTSSKNTSQSVSQDVSQNVSQDVSQNVSQVPSNDISQVQSQRTSNEIA